MVSSHIKYVPIASQKPKGRRSVFLCGLARCRFGQTHQGDVHSEYPSPSSSPPSPTSSSSACSSSSSSSSGTPCLKATASVLSPGSAEQILLIPQWYPLQESAARLDFARWQVRFYAGPGKTSHCGHRYCNQHGRQIDFPPEDPVLLRNHKRWPLAPCQFRIRKAVRRRCRQWGT